jgi:hypothetical protein
MRREANELSSGIAILKANVDFAVENYEQKVYAAEDALYEKGYNSNESYTWVYGVLAEKFPLFVNKLVASQVSGKISVTVKRFEYVQKVLRTCYKDTDNYTQFCEFVDLTLNWIRVWEAYETVKAFSLQNSQSKASYTLLLIKKRTIYSSFCLLC